MPAEIWKQQQEEQKTGGVYMGKNNGDLFRTTLMGGYDKDDVSEGITSMKDENYAERCV